MKWISVDDRPPNENRGRVLVTNNIKARDAYGGMSHIWIVFPILSSEPEKYGKWTAFDEGDHRICNITHWMPLPTGDGYSAGESVK